MHIIHLSDLHIGGDESNKSSVCTLRCQTVVDNIIARCKPASDYAVVITGDITDGGTVFSSGGIKKQYEEAATLLIKLHKAGFVVLPVPGNHDYGSMGVHPKKKYGKLFREMLLGKYQGTYPILGRAHKQGLIKKIAFIGLDSMEAAITRDYYYGAQGKIGAPQLKRLKAMLDSDKVKRADARVLYLHHHPFSPEPNMELHDAAALQAAIKGKKVDTLLFGHNHNGWKWNGWWDITRSYDAGTSTRKGGSAGYHRIMNPTKDLSTDYDGDFLGNLKAFTT